MFPGLLLGIALGAPPSTSATIPSPAQTHLDAVAHFGAALWNVRRERLLTAVKELEEAARKDPTAAEPKRELVRVYTLLGREPEAIRAARQILIQNPDDFEIAHSLAKLLFEAGELKEAVAVAKLAAGVAIPIARAEQAVAIYRDLATLCEKAKDPAAAEAALRKALELVVDQRKEVIEARALTPRQADRLAAECQERLGNVLTTLRKFDEAATAYAAAAALFSDPNKANDPSSAAKLDWNLSGVLQAKGDAQAALEHLNRLLKLKPLFAEPYLRLAQLLRDTNRENDIVAELERLQLKYQSEGKAEKNLPLLTVLAIEMYRLPDALHKVRADECFDTVMKQSNDPRLMKLVLHSYLDRGKTGQIMSEVDHLFSRLKELDQDEKQAETPESREARAFAAEKVRVIADILNQDSEATTKVLEATRTDLRAGIKRGHQSLYLLGQLAARHGKLGLAEALFTDAVLTSPKETRGDAYIAYIDVLRKAGKPAKLVETCRRGLRDVDTIAPFFFNYYLSEALAELGRADEAIAAADKAIEEIGHNDRLTVKLHKVTILRILEKWDDAIALANKLADEFPTVGDRLQIRFALATTFWNAGKREQSETELRAILEQDPDLPEACNELGYHLADLGRNLDEAERLIRHAIEVDRYERKKSGAAILESGVYIDSLGWALFRQGKLEEARTQLEKASALPDAVGDPIVWDHLGDVLFRLGEKPKAKEAWKKSVELYGNDPRASRRNADRLEEAKRKLKRVP